jgi:hypothetical protein
MELDHQTRHRLAMYVRYGDNIAKGMIEENDRLEREERLEDRVCEIESLRIQAYARDAIAYAREIIAKRAAIAKAKGSK